uniref:ZAD domain-containing protein n=1 Tax=Oryzias sinensis TaxID=183150 RepID=A0A8C7WW60_9TELE
MSSRGRNGFCRICGGDLQGNQRRWLFGSQNKKGSHVDLLSVLTHILGQQVPRGSGREEFVCGKCVSALERVFKFDSVISRVRVLSTERLQKLTQERDKVRQWVRSNYRQRHLQEFQSRSSISEDDGEMEKEAYRDMLKENMALSGYECWSERWDTCPYFIRTGKRCRRGKGCEGCDSLRVSDSDYESVCGIPRHLPSDAFSPLGDRSSSMPLHWQKGPTISSSPASLAGSSLSLRAPSRTQSVQSLDLLDGNDPVDLTGVQQLNFVLMELRGVEAKPVSSPSGSRIPVLGKNTGKSLDKTDGGASPRVSRVLSFAENGKDGMDEEDGDVLMELRDEYMPLREIHERLCSPRLSWNLAPTAQLDSSDIAHNFVALIMLGWGCEGCKLVGERVNRELSALGRVNRGGVAPHQQSQTMSQKTRQVFGFSAENCMIVIKRPLETF